MSDLTSHQKEDAEFIRNPGHWPKWPSLPMKNNRKGKPDAGFLLDRQPIDGGPYPKDAECLRTVYEMSPWEFFTDPNRPKLDKIPKTVYATVEEMILDGWEVD